LARDWIERTWGVVYQPRAVRKIFHRLELSFTKPTYTLSKADHVRQVAFKEEFEGAKNWWVAKLIESCLKMNR